MRLAHFYNTMSKLSREFILQRAQKSCAVASAIRDAWEWEEWSAEEMLQEMSRVKGLQNVLSGAEAAADGARGELDGALGRVYAMALTGTGLARVKWRGDAGRRRILKSVDLNNNGRPAMRLAAQQWASAWSRLEVAWVLPLADGASISHAAYQSLRREIEGDGLASPVVPGLLENLESAVLTVRGAADDLQKALKGLEGLMEAWYAAATAVFGEDTAEGRQLRGQVPTTYVPVPAAGPGGRTKAIPA